jgi:LacI family transcriptional regulator
MRDVAAAAGVSLKTVSRVVNHEPGVRSDVRGRVNQAIARLDYQRDDRARSLRASSRESRAIGLIQVDVANPFFSATFRGIEDVAVANGYQVLAGSTDGDSERQDAVLRTLISRRVDGIILVPSGDELDLVSAEMARNTPFVFLDLEPRDLRADVVRSDHKGGAMTLTDHLLVQGHQRIAFLGDDPNIFSASQRFDGFRQAMRSAGIDPNENWIYQNVNQELSRRIVGELFVDGHGNGRAPTAIISAQNFITLGTVRALHEHGLHHKIAHVGFDDVDLADVVDPGITVMPQNPRQLGASAANLLISRLDGRNEPPTIDIHRCELIQRGSGEIAPRD